jgi:DNA polymerase/3'-5' exonuclease PolX
MSETRYPRERAYTVADSIVNALRPACERIEIAGSLRRHKPDVGDIEILYIPVMQDEPDPVDFFAERRVSLADGRIEGLIRAGVLEKRLNAKGLPAFGEKNKLMRHVASRIPVDLFAATWENWHNYMVCRTGPADLNTRICMAAQRKGWKWNPYGAGFSNPDGEVLPMATERAVFEFVGLSYCEPEARA